MSGVNEAKLKEARCDVNPLLACWEKTGLRTAGLGLPLRSLPAQKPLWHHPLLHCSKCQSLAQPLTALTSPSFSQHKPLLLGPRRALLLADLQSLHKQAANCLSDSLKASLAWPCRSWEGFASPWGKDVLLSYAASEWDVLLSPPVLGGLVLSPFPGTKAGSASLFDRRGTGGAKSSALRFG